MSLSLKLLLTSVVGAAACLLMASWFLWPIPATLDRDVAGFPGLLDRDERRTMNEHPVKGEEILKGVKKLAPSCPSSAITKSGTTAPATR